MNISFIGFGRIAKALAKGFLNDKENKIRAAAPSLTIGINNQGIATHHDNCAVVADADIIILAVKPMLMEAVFEQIRLKLPSNALLISVASGITLNWFIERAPNTAVIRVMPNLAASIGQSATPLIANDYVTGQQKKWAEKLFKLVGIIAWAQQESDMDSFTALSGSGPAYVFLFMEAMIKAAIDMGLEPSIAKDFTLQTISGALALAQAGTVNIEDLRHQVTSPKGTTAAALEVLAKEKFPELIAKAMEAARNRAQELGSFQPQFGG
jgi:pyrroline-5-carboxylate reductase